MITAQEAQRFSDAWIGAWNSHDVEAILAHYREDVTFTSPFTVEVVGAPDGVVRGRADLRDYFTRGLAAYPELHFKPIAALAGVDSVVLHYHSVGGREAMEVMELDADGLVRRVSAHYTDPAAG